MSSSGVCVSCTSITFNKKLNAFENTLHKSAVDFKEIIKDFEELSMENEDYKRQLIQQKEKCERKSCSSAEALKKTIEYKDHIIQLVGLFDFKNGKYLLWQGSVRTEYKPGNYLTFVLAN
ncbi:hypothetical protein evm_015498 [Chilo suppressalis]|nr:hypothetical protein evm_015498 [Chilo suppressalis]